MKHLVILVVAVGLVLCLYAVGHEADADGQKARADQLTDDYIGSP